MVISFEDFFRMRNPKHAWMLSRMREAMGVSEVTYKDINSMNLRVFKEYMTSRVTANSLFTYFGIVKATIRECIYEKMIDNPHCIDVLKVKKTPSQNACLTEEELMKFDEYEPRNETERDVKILFMRGALSGARSCDCAEMKVSNISNGVLTYVSQKTKIGVSQPLHKRLEKYLMMQPSKEHKRMVVNRSIRKICKRLGFDEMVSLSRNGKMVTKHKYEWITMHCSRRTYVSSLVARGVPISVVSKLAGHTSTAMTDKYVCNNVLKLDDAAMSFFNG